MNTKQGDPLCRLWRREFERLLLAYGGKPSVHDARLWVLSTCAGHMSVHVRCTCVTLRFLEPAIFLKFRYTAELQSVSESGYWPMLDGCVFEVYAELRRRLRKVHTEAQTSAADAALANVSRRDVRRAKKAAPGPTAASR